ncbi:MAG: hypothetical protein AAFU79_23330 [Myxococcota bacterium]
MVHAAYRRLSRSRGLRATALAAVALGLLGTAACDGPCRTLAERVCTCEFNAREQASCFQEIDTNGNVRMPTPEEDEACMAFLDSCTCEALEAEQFAACGLTKTNPNPP